MGAGKVGHLVARRLLGRPEFGLQPVGFLDNDPLEIEGRATALPVLGASWDLERILEEHDVEHVIFTFSTAPHAVMLNMVRRCRELGVSASLVPRLFEVSVERVTVEHLGGLPLLEMRPIDPKGWQFLVKYALDRVVAGRDPAAVAHPADAGAAVLITSGRPILFRQRRIGLDGQEFDMLKFRTMKGSPESSRLTTATGCSRPSRAATPCWPTRNPPTAVATGRPSSTGTGTATATAMVTATETAGRGRRRPDVRRGPPHADRPHPAPLLAGRAAPASQRLEGATCP